MVECNIVTSPTYWAGGEFHPIWDVDHWAIASTTQTSELTWVGSATEPTAVTVKITVTSSGYESLYLQLRIDDADDVSSRVTLGVVDPGDYVVEMTPSAIGSLTGIFIFAGYAIMDITEIEVCAEAEGVFWTNNTGQSETCPV